MAARKPTKGHVLLEGRIPGRWIAGVLVAFGVLFVVAVIGFSAVNRIDACEACHIIKPEVATYKQSAHYRAGVGCQKCHTKPGVFNYLIRNLQGASNLILYASGQYERPLTTFVGSANCAQCHPNSQIEKDLVVGGIRVNHKGLREAGYQCIACHANISHPGTQLAVARASQSKMSICARCHDGKQLPDTCSTCHISGVPANAPKVAMRLHVTPSQCRGCHEKKTFCMKCHNGLEMPHPKRWNKVHGGVVLDRRIGQGLYPDRGQFRRLQPIQQPALVEARRTRHDDQDFDHDGEEEGQQQQPPGQGVRRMEFQPLPPVGRQAQAPAKGAGKGPKAVHSGHDARLGPEAVPFMT